MQRTLIADEVQLGSEAAKGSSMFTTGTTLCPDLYALPYRPDGHAVRSIPEAGSGLVRGMSGIFETRLQEQIMNKDQIKGRVRRSKGKVKQEAGKAFGNESLQEKGRAAKNIGKAQVAYGDLKQNIKKSNRIEY